MRNNIDLKNELALQAEAVSAERNEKPRITKNMDTSDMITALMPEIKKALPSVLTPERFTRMALSAVNNNPVLKQCTPISFLSALMCAAQLGLEPNTPLGQAYLLPFKNKGVLECQFIIGYKGLIDLAYRNGDMQMIQAHTVYENDEFEYELGLEPKIFHRPAPSDRGKPVYFYGIFRTTKGGCGFSVMSKADMDLYARTYSKSAGSDYSPWKTSYIEMAKKTVIRRALKYAPIKTDFQRAISADGSIKKNLSVNMSEVRNEEIQAENEEDAYVLEEY
ncbi:MAG: recombinase RecT [Lachnospiraceae bacterium]|nr:recombinase RecT [Lachnospiraceae bacterium]